MPTYLFLQSHKRVAWKMIIKHVGIGLPDAEAARAWRDEHWPGCRVAMLLEELTLGEAMNQAYFAGTDDEPEAPLKITITEEDKAIAAMWAQRYKETMAQDDAVAPAQPRSGLTRPLTQRESEIAKLANLGYTNKAIAESLGLAHSTIRSHRVTMAAKGFVPIL